MFKVSLPFIQPCKRFFHVCKRNGVPSTDFNFTRQRKLYDPFYKHSIYGEIPRTKVAGNYFITLIRGTGIGPELMDAVQTVFECGNVPVQFDVFDMPATATDEEFSNMMTSIRRCGACIKAFIQAADIPSGPLSRNKVIRNDLTLYAYLRHFRSIPTIPTTKNKKVDIVLISQNIEGEYSMLEHQSTSDVVTNLKVVTRENTEKLAKFTFDIAKQSDRKRVMCIIVEGVTPNLFVNTIVDVSKCYNDVEFKINTTAGAMHNIMLHPENEDVIVVESLYGSILSACLFSMIGSPALVAGCNYGDRYAVFEPAARAQGRRVAGTGVANPTGALFCGVQLLRYLDLCEHANLIEDAVLKTLQEDRVFTPDLGGEATTADFVFNVVNRMRENMSVISLCNLDEPPELPCPPKEPPPPFDQKSYEREVFGRCEKECDDLTI